MARKNPKRNISRIDMQGGSGKSYGGWEVRMQRKGEKIEKYFSDRNMVVVEVLCKRPRLFVMRSRVNTISTLSRSSPSLPRNEINRESLGFAFTARSIKEVTMNTTIGIGSLSGPMVEDDAAPVRSVFINMERTKRFGWHAKQGPKA